MSNQNQTIENTDLENNRDSKSNNLIQNESDPEFYDAEEFDDENKKNNKIKKPEKDKLSENESDSDVDHEKEHEQIFLEDNCGSSSEEFDFDSTNPQLNKIKSKFDRFNISNDTNQTDNKAESNILDENNESKNFVPLHQKLNEEININKSNRKHLDDSENEEAINDLDNENEQAMTSKNDPYFIDELMLKNQLENLTEEQKEEMLKEAQEFKKVGNDFFKEEKYLEALDLYTKALRTCPYSYLKERSIFYSNRSVCFFKLKQNENCIRECTKSIELDSTFLKPLLRRAECFQLIDKLEDSLTDYKKLYELEPKNFTHKQKFYELEEKIKERNEKLKEEMMGKLKELGNMVLKPFGLSTNNFQFVQDPTTGSYSVNFNKS